MIHILCVKWGDLYHCEYVNKLYNSIKRNTTKDFKFICFTEDTNGISEEIECRDFVHKELTGWWNKMYLFSNDLNITDRILYFDLDTVITGNIDEFMEFDGNFAILQDLYRVENNKEDTSFGSAIMSWKGGQQNSIWETFASNMAANSAVGGGDQRYLMANMNIEHITFWQKYLQRTKLVSYKVKLKDKELKEELLADVSVICFHGIPRPHEIRNEPWMIEHWK